MHFVNEKVEKIPFRAKVKGKWLRKARQYDDERASSESSSDSESELEEQVRQRKTKKIKINCSRAKAEERKECQKGSDDEESEHKYDDRVSFHANGDSEMAS